ncbi:unnamed protein product [Lathyrus oleraceus]|nr:transcription factor TCP1-like [Pisum sativum]
MFSFPNNFPSSSSSSYPNNFPSSSSSSYPNNNNNNTLSFLIDNNPQNNDFPSLLDDPLSSLPFTTSTTHHHDVVVPLFHDHETTTLASNLAVSDYHNNNGSMFEPPDSSNFGGFPNFLVKQKQPSVIVGKKDRHSKIHTSQGLRDRRVRLSSEIARKFFDLQDMLEFDKPSNTLEWLFNKSDTAIKELARTKNACYNNNNDDNNINNNNAFFESNSNKSFSGGGADGGCSKGRKLKWTQKEETKKESRERARARARERTCYKMCSSGRMQEEIRYSSIADSTANAQMLQQLMSSTSSPVDSTETEAYARWRHLLQLQTYNNPSYSHNHHHTLMDCEIPRDHGGFNLIEESIMIKRNMMSSSSSSSSHYQHHQQNLIPNIPKELPSFNNNTNDYSLFPYSTSNWENNNGGCSNFCGIATMNLSSCFMNQ